MAYDVINPKTINIDHDSESKTLEQKLNELTSGKQTQITSGTANPAGGNNGDVYIKV